MSGHRGRGGTAGTPYVGLRPFEFRDAPLFFGRQVQIESLSRKLKGRRFLAVIGRSGSGKSSLVKAGLLPALSREEVSGQQRWHVAVMRPGGAPLRSLALAVSELADRLSRMPSDDEHSALQREVRVRRYQAALRRSSLGLASVANELPVSSGHRILLIVDQFEEIFRYGMESASQGIGCDADGRENVPSENVSDGGVHYDETAAFVKLLLTASRSELAPVYVLLTLRLDFLGDCARFRDLPESINDSQFLVPRLTRSERREAIERPAIERGWSIEPVLLQRMLNDAGDDPDQLPVLQHALMRTALVAGADRQLRLRHYEGIGGVHAALSNHADEILRSLSSRGLDSPAERLFKALTDVDREGRAGRRPMTLRELVPVLGADGSAAETVVEAFRAEDACFLMPPGRRALRQSDRIDVSHEALIRKWKRLSGTDEELGWVREEAEDGRIYAGLVESAEAFGRDDENVLPPAITERRLEWWDTKNPTAAWAERYGGNFEQVETLLKVSETHRRSETKKQARYVQMTRLLLGLVIASVVTAAVSWVQWRRADRAVQAAEIEQALRRDAQSAKDNAEEQQRMAEQQKRIADEERSVAMLAQAEAEEAQSRAQGLAEELRKQLDEVRKAQEAELKAQRAQAVAESDRAKAVDGLVRAASSSSADANQYVEDALGSLFRRHQDSVVKVLSPDSLPRASGFVVSPHGHVMTVAYAIDDDWTDVIVETASSERLRGKVLYRSRDRFIAILQVQSIDSDLPPLSLGSGMAPEGDKVLAIGFPQAGPLRTSHIGTVSSINPEFFEVRFTSDLSRPDSSGLGGAPVLNSLGEAIGIWYASRPEDLSIRICARLDSVLELLRDNEINLNEAE